MNNDVFDFDIDIEDEYLEDLEQILPSKSKQKKAVYDKDDDVTDGMYNAIVDQADKIIHDYYEKYLPGAEAWTDEHAHYIAEQSIADLITKEEFLGLPVMDDPSVITGVYPAVIEDCIRIWEERKKRPITLVVCEEGFGSGKTFKESILLWLQWVELCKYTNPQSYFNLRPDSWIAFMCFSRTEPLARRVAFTEVWNRFTCTFNRKYFPATPYLKREIQVKRNHTVVYAGSSSALSAIGYSLFGGINDESDFLEVIEDSKRSQDDWSSIYDEAEELLDAVRLRMVSRYNRSDGTLPGFVACVSSARYEDDFTDKKIKEARMKGYASSIFYTKRATYEAKPKWMFPSNEFFYINTDTMEQVPKESAKVFLALMEAIEDSCFLIEDLQSEMNKKLVRIGY